MGINVEQKSEHPTRPEEVLELAKRRANELSKTLDDVEMQVDRLKHERLQWLAVIDALDKQEEPDIRPRVAPMSHRP